MTGACPGRSRLERMLADELSPEEAAALELHVSACPSCLKELEALTDAGPPSPRESLPYSPDFHRRLLARPPMPPPHELPTTAPGVAYALGPAPRPEVEGYEILGELGRGGMGVVYQALDVRLRRVVALKMLPAGAQAPAELVARFLTEAETVARVQHANVVQIYAIGEHDGLPFFEMEYVEGGSLASRLDGTPWHPREAARLVEAAALGVEAVHRLGVVHRDLKPSNILMGLLGEPKIGDFGLAKDLASDSGLTRTDVVLGSPSYMSPEQAEGQSTRVGPSADVYALGAVLYELLTGRPPFRSASVLETLQQVKSADPVPPSRLVPGVDRDAETIALKCLEKAPSRRYASAAELADDLRRFLDRRPILARRVGPAGRLVRFCRRNPGIAGLAAAVLLLLGLVAGVSLAAAIRITVTAEAERRGRYFARMNLVQLAYEAADVRRMRELLAPYAPGGVDGDLRSFEWNYWSRLARRFDAELVGHAGPAVAVAFSPDGKSVISADDRLTVIVWDRATGQARSTLRSPHKPTTLAISPNGSTIVAGTDNGAIVIWGPGDRNPWVSPCPTRSPVAALRFVDESTLVSAHDPNFARTWDLRSRRLVDESRGPDLDEGSIRDFHARAHALSSDGKLLAAADRVGRVQVRPVGAPKSGPIPSRTIKVGDLPARSIAFSGDGRTLAVGGEDHVITLVDLERDERPIVLRGHGASIWSMDFSPGGKTLAAASLDNTASLWDVASGRQVDALKGHGAPLLAIAYATDGKTIATGSVDKTVKLWRVGEEDLDVFTDGGRIGLDSIAFNHDGSTLAVGARDGRITLWTTATRRPIASTRPRSEANPDAHSSYIMELAFSPDGQILYSAGLRGPIRLWDARTLAPLGTLQSGPDGPHDYKSMALSPGGQIVAAGREDGEITLWDTRSRGRIATIVADRKPIGSLAFSPDGKTLASSSIGEGVQVWDLATKKRSAQLNEDDWGVQSVAFSPDGRTLVAGDRQGRLIFWDPTGRSPASTQSAHSNEVTSLAFTPDGQSLFSGGRDDVIRIWDLATRELKSTFKGHAGNVLALQVSRDGRSLASASLDGTARIWREVEVPAPPSLVVGPARPPGGTP